MARLLAAEHEVVLLERGEHVAVADRRLDDRRCRRASSARRSPRFDITVTAIASLRSSAALVRGRARAIAMIWSPSTSSPRSSTAITRSASPSSASPTSAPCVAHGGLQRLGVRRAAAVVDVAAVGLGVEHVDVGAERAATRAAPTRDAAPFAQSTHDVQPVERAARRARRRGARRTRRPRSRRASDADDVDRGAGSASERRAARASIARLDLVAELAAAGARRASRRCRPGVVAGRDRPPPGAVALREERDGRRRQRRRRGTTSAPSARARATQRGLDARARLARVAADDERARRRAPAPRRDRAR